MHLKVSFVTHQDFFKAIWYGRFVVQEDNDICLGTRTKLSGCASHLSIRIQTWQLTHSQPTTGHQPLQIDVAKHKDILKFSLKLHIDHENSWLIAGLGQADLYNQKYGWEFFKIDTNHIWKLMVSELPPLHTNVPKWPQQIW